MMGRKVKLAIVAAVLGISFAAEAQQTLITINPGGNPGFKKQASSTPWTTNDLLCATANNQIGIGGTCNTLGGGGALKRKCATTGSIGAGALSNICVTWDVAYPDTTYDIASCGVTDTPTTSIAALMCHHLTTKTTTQACAVAFNQDAETAHTGTLCLIGAN